MSPRQKYLLVSLIILLFGGYGVYYSLYSLYSSSSTPLSRIPIPFVRTPSPPPEPPKPSFSVLKKDDRTIIVTWSNLPEGTTGLNIFRAKKDDPNDEGSLWATIQIPPGGAGGGSEELKLKPGENADNYSFYAQGTGGGGGNSSSTPSITWTSSSTVPQVLPPPTPTSTPSSNSGSPSAGPTSQPSSTPTQTPSSTSQGPTSPPPSPPQSTSTVTYYTPDGQVSTTTSATVVNFGVRHTNRNIEVYWQALPAGTDEIAVFRSEQAGGPWTKLLGQKNPLSQASIYLVDYSLHETLYYRMDTFNDGVVTNVYGPVVLPPLD